MTPPALSGKLEAIPDLNDLREREFFQQILPRSGWGYEFNLGHNYLLFAFSWRLTA